MQEDIKPVFSIITPTFKRPGLLKRAVVSVRNQDYCDYEHIIIDDANDQETEHLIKSFDDDKIIFHQHPIRKGAAGAYNTGIKLSRGKFILFLDDDDEYLSSLLKTLHSQLVQSDDGTGFIWTGVAVIKDNKQKEKLLFVKLWPAIFRDRETGLIAATTIGNGYGLCVRRECIDSIGLFDESIPFGQDADFLFRLARNYNFKTIPEVLVKIHYHENNQLTNETNNLLRLELREKILARNMDLLNRFPRLYHIHFKHIADLSYNLGLKGRGRAIMFDLMRRQPLRIHDYFDLISYELSGRDFLTVFYLRKLKRLIISPEIKHCLHRSRNTKAP